MPFVQTNPIQMADNTANALVVREKVGGVNYVETDTLNGSEVTRIHPVGQGPVEFFGSSPEGVTAYVSISGYKTSGSLAEARLGVGVHRDQVFSIYNAVGYYFDNNVGIGRSNANYQLETRGSRTAPGANIFGTIYTSSTNAFAAGMGGGIVFGGVYTGASVAEFSQILGVKANGVDGNYDGEIQFWVRQHLSSMVKHLTLKADGDFLVNTGNLGIGVTPTQKFEIGSNDNSKRISIYHNNSDAYFKWDDGVLYLMSNEGTNAQTEVWIEGHGTGRALLYLKDGDTGGNSLFIQDGGRLGISNSDTGGIRIEAINGDIEFQFGAGNNIRCFRSSGEGETRYISLTGYRTSGSLAELRIAVGQYVDKVASFYNVSGGFHFELPDNLSTVFKLSESGNIYFSINSNTGSRQINYGVTSATRHSFDMYPSDALAFRIGEDTTDWFVIDTANQIQIQYKGMSFTNELEAGNGFVDAGTARSSEDSIQGEFHIFVTPSGSSNDYYAFGDKYNGQVIMVTNDGSVNALIDQDETGGMDLCTGRTVVARWHVTDDRWYYA